MMEFWMATVGVVSIVCVAALVLEIRDGYHADEPEPRRDWWVTDDDAAR